MFENEPLVGLLGRGDPRSHLVGAGGLDFPADHRILDIRTVDLNAGCRILRGSPAYGTAGRLHASSLPVASCARLSRVHNKTLGAPPTQREVKGRRAKGGVLYRPPPAPPPRPPPAPPPRPPPAPPPRPPPAPPPRPPPPPPPRPPPAPPPRMNIVPMLFLIMVLTLSPNPIRPQYDSKHSLAPVDR